MGTLTAWGELNSRWARWGFIRHLARIAHVGVLASGSTVVSASCSPRTHFLSPYSSSESSRCGIQAVSQSATMPHSLLRRAVCGVTGLTLKSPGHAVPRENTGSNGSPGGRKFFHTHLADSITFLLFICNRVSLL